MSPRALRLSLLGVVAVALATFATALRGSFVNWDDGWIILQNPYIRGWGHLGAILDPTGSHLLLGAEYLPIRDLSHVCDFALFGTEPTGYRLGNWLLYGLSAGGAYLFLLEALRSPRAALAGALLWAVHPLHAEVVPWASARKDLLDAVFALVAGTLHLRSARTGSRATGWAATGLFLLATLSKSATAGLPFLLAGWEVVAGDGGIPLRRRVAAALRRAAPMMALAVAGALVNARHQAEAGAIAEWRGGDPLANLFVMAEVHLRYLRQAVWPAGLTVDYPVRTEDVPSPAGLAGLFVAAGLLGAGGWLALRRRVEGLAVLWWFAILAPVSNLLVPITNVSADRYLFLPLLGPCALAGLGFERLCRAGPAATRGAAGALAAVVLALGAAAAVQATVWRDGVTLWSRAVALSPGVGRAWMNYGEALAAAGRTDEALRAFRRTVEVEPGNPYYWIHTGNRLVQVGGPPCYDEAERAFRTAVDKAAKGTGAPHVALAWYLLDRGRTAEAVALLEEAIRRQPDLGPAHLNLGLFHFHEGRWARAADELEEALRVGLSIPEQVQAHDGLFRACEKMGDFEQARRHREERERLTALTRGE